MPLTKILFLFLIVLFADINDLFYLQVRPLKAQKGGPLSSNLLEYVLGYLFPDAGSQHNAYHKYSNSDRLGAQILYLSTVQSLILK